MTTDTHASRRWEKGALLVGFVSLAAAVILAHGSPPETYELSIYAGTPLAFWLGAAVGLLAAVFVGLYADGRMRRLALVLGGTTMLAVASLPVLRSYYFFGAGDSLTHLGWAKDIAAGELSPLNFLYPGTHTVAIFLADATGMPVRRALLVMVMVFTAVFLLFVPLTTWAITRSRRATTVAALSGLLLLPINNISVFTMAHPTSQAILFFPLVAYLLGRYVTDADRADLPVGTPTGALMAVSSVAIVLVHPQQAANVIFVFGAALAVQLLARWLGGREGEHRTLALQTAFLVGVFLLWAPRHERTSGATSALVNMLLHGPDIGNSVGQRALSLSAIGGSIWVLFAKLFLVSLVFAGLTALLVFGGLRGRFDDSDTNAFARYFGLALVPLLGLFAAYLLVSYAQLHFRQLGFVMVLATVMGAIAISKAMGGLSTRLSPGTARAAVGIVFVVMLALAVPTVYQSPYMYQGSSHVTEAQMTGYGFAFDHAEDDRFYGIRGSGERFADGVLGFVESRRRTPAAGSIYADTNLTSANFTGDGVARSFDGGYLAYTDAAYQQDVVVYDGLRFPASGFRSLDATPGLNRVQANEGFQMYAINETRA